MTVTCRFQLERAPFHLHIDTCFAAKITGVFGPSGSGKSTLLHLLAGIDKPDGGRLTINGELIFDSEKGINTPCHARRVGMVFQQGRLFPQKTVAANLCYGLELLPQGERLFGFEHIVDLLELRPLLAFKPAQLSGGEAQRVALGRAILSSPRLLLLDEPMAALDRGLKRQILPFLRRISEETDIPMIYVSHDLQELLQLTDQLLVLGRGQQLAQGRFLDLVQQVDVLELMHDLGLLNVVPMIATPCQKRKGLARLVPATTKGERAESSTWIGPAIETQRTVFAVLRPEDIALVKQPVPDISIRNQIQGTVVNIVVASQRALCIVNIGVEVLVEVSTNAISDMGLTRGQSIYCLFKALAIRYW